MRDDPFALLGLPPQAGLTDDEVRAAWRRIAAATHPDREDGGDPARFGAAAAAYVLLRTSYGRGEALADLAEQSGPVPRRRKRPPARTAAHRRDGARPAGSHRMAGQPAPARRLNSHRLNSHRLGPPRPCAPRPRAGRRAGVRVSGPRVTMPRVTMPRVTMPRAGLRRLTVHGNDGHRFSGRRMRPGRPGTRGYRSPGYRASAAWLGARSPGWSVGLPVTSAAAVAAATVAAVGVTPATIGLLAGALTVTGWALWRRAGGGQ